MYRTFCIAYHLLDVVNSIYSTCLVYQVVLHINKSVIICIFQGLRINKKYDMNYTSCIKTYNFSYKSTRSQSRRRIA